MHTPAKSAMGMTREGSKMAFKHNYRQERAQRTRARETKQQEKLLRREEASARRKALRETAPDAGIAMPAPDEPAKEAGE
jgi:hypothetical protein